MRIIQVLIIVFGLFFLPNRYIPVEPKTENVGVVVDETKWGLSKTGFSSNYVKIKLIKGKACFWYSLYMDSKPLGSKCVVSIRRGIFGMRYVEKVEFLGNQG